MKNYLRMILLAALLLLVGGSAAYAQVSFGIRIGPPPAPRVVHVIPPRPGPDYVWIDGYWYPVDGRYRWHEGYWTRAPYGGAYWVPPRYEGGEFFEGYWEGPRGRFEHHHEWDLERGRDYNRWREHEEHEPY